MTHKCEGILKSGVRIGEPCGKTASYSANNGEAFYCCIHKVVGSESLANARPPRSSPKTAESIANVYNDIYESILARIQDGSVQEAPQFVALTAMPPNERVIVIRRASELAGVKDDIFLIARQIDQAIIEFTRACREPRLPIEIEIYHLSAIGGQWNKGVVSEQFCFEEGNFVSFPDVDMHITNCSPDYLRHANMTFQEFCSIDEVIYAGPSGIIQSPIGESLPAADSEWYIPLPRDCPLRQLHNKAKVVQILTDISEGRDSVEKYLSLRGRLLACVCMPYPCHCEVYVEVVRELLKAEAMMCQTSTTSLKP